MADGFFEEPNVEEDTGYEPEETIDEDLEALAKTPGEIGVPSRPDLATETPGTTSTPAVDPATGEPVETGPDGQPVPDVTDPNGQAPGAPPADPNAAPNQPIGSPPGSKVAPLTPDDDWSGTPTTSAHGPDWGYGDPTGFGEYVEQKVDEYGWDREDLPALIALWNETSSPLTASHTGQIAWDPSAENPINGASGIPGLLPDTVETLGDPMQWDNPTHQIDVGLEYIKGRYGTPRAALQHMLWNDWY